MRIFFTLMLFLNAFLLGAGGAAFFGWWGLLVSIPAIAITSLAYLNLILDIMEDEDEECGCGTCC